VSIEGADDSGGAGGEFEATGLSLSLVNCQTTRHGTREGPKTNTASLHMG